MNPVKPDTIRSRLMLEIASEIVSPSTWPYRQALVALREQGGSEWRLRLFGSDNPSSIDDVARGEVHVAIINPAAPLTLAVRGTGPFRKPVPLRAIATIPSLDQMAFAVAGHTGLTSLEEIRERRFPLRVSVRAESHHSIHLYIREVLSAVGWSLDDLQAWGGEVHFSPWPPNVEGVARGEVDAVFDEAVPVWLHRALELGMRFLPLKEPVLRRLEDLGFRRAVIAGANYNRLPEDVPTLDFSGWTVYTHADVPDEVITAACSALDTRRDRIPWHGEGPLPIERMCRDNPDTPLDIPLHPAAERYWRERGYLD